MALSERFKQFIRDSVRDPRFNQSQVPSEEAFQDNIRKGVFETAREEKNRRAKAELDRQNKNLVEEKGAEAALDPNYYFNKAKKGTIGALEATRDVGEFVDPTQEIEVRPMLAEQGQTATRKGGKVFGNIEPLTARIIEGIARQVPRAAANVKGIAEGTGEAEVDLGIDARRFGDRQENFESSGQRFMGLLSQFDNESPETPTWNLFRAYLEGPTLDIFDTFDLGGVTSGLGRLTLTATDELTRGALRRMGLEGVTDPDVAMRSVQNTVERIRNTDVPNALKDQEARQFFQDLDILQRQTQGGARVEDIANQGVISEAANRLARAGLSDPFGPAERIFGQGFAGGADEAVRALPGTRTRPGQARPAGASIQEFENVGRETNITPDVAGDAGAVGVRQIAREAIDTIGVGRTPEDITPRREDITIESEGTPQAEETVSADEVAERVREMGTDGGFTEPIQQGQEPYLIRQIQDQGSFAQQEVRIDELRQGDEGLDSYIKSGEIRDFEPTATQVDPIVTADGDVLDGYNRIAQALADGQETVPVLRGVNQAIEGQQQLARNMSQANVLDETRAGGTITGYRTRDVNQPVTPKNESLIQDRPVNDGLGGTPGVDFAVSVEDARQAGGIRDTREIDTSNFLSPTDQQLSREIVENMLERAPKIEKALEVGNESLELGSDEFNQRLGFMADKIMDIDNPQWQMRNIWEKAYKGIGTGMTRTEQSDYFRRSAVANNIDGLRRTDGTNERLAVYNDEILESGTVLTDEMTKAERLEVALAPVEQTTKVVKNVVDEFGLDTVNKQQIENILNKTAKDSGVKKPERFAIEEALKEFDTDEVPVGKFIEQVDARLLPIRHFSVKEDFGATKWGTQARLDDGLRGDVASYDEHIYESPIKNKAGGYHWADMSEDNYFMHSRLEYMADDKTVRINELQSDLFQKGRFEKPVKDLVENYVYSYEGITSLSKALDKFDDDTVMQYLNYRRENDVMSNDLYDQIDEIAAKGKQELRDATRSPMGGTYKAGIMNKGQIRDVLNVITKNRTLQNYKNIWHETLIRNELALHRDAGKSRVLFPVSRTVANIQGMDRVRGNVRAFMDMIQNGTMRAGHEQRLPEPAFGNEVDGWNEITFLENGGSPSQTFITEKKNVIFTYDLDVFAYNFSVFSTESQNFANEYFDLGYDMTDVYRPESLGGVSSGEFEDAVDNAISDLSDLELMTMAEEFAKSNNYTIWKDVAGREGGRADEFTMLENDDVRTIEDLENYYNEMDMENPWADHPTVRFYEEDVAEYVQKNFDAQKITDDQGMEWYEVKTENVRPGPPGVFGDEFFKPKPSVSEDDIFTKNARAIANQSDTGRIEAIMRKDMNLGGNTRQVAEGLSTETDAQRVEEVIQMSITDGSIVRRGDNDLIAIHNTRASNIETALESGGMAAPSIAVTRKGIPHDKFGGISFIFDQSVIDPKKPNIRAFTGDTYTAETPLPDYDNTLNELFDPNKHEDLRQKLEENDVYYADFDDSTSRADFEKRLTRKDVFTDEEASEIADEFFSAPILREKRNMPTGELRELIEEYPPFEEMFREASSWKDFRNRFLNDQGAVQTMDRRAGELGDEYVERFDDYNEAQPEYYNLLRQGYERKIDYTDPAEVARYMGARADETGDTRGLSAFAPARIFAYDEVQSIDDIRKVKDLFEEDDIAKASNQIITDEYEEFMSELGYDLETLEEFTEIVLKQGSAKSTFDIMAVTERYPFLPSIMDEEAAERISELLQEGFVEAKRAYAEVKPFRKVDFNETQGAIVPDDTPQDLIDRMREAGVPKIVKYGPESGTTRQDAVDSMASGNMFSGIGGVSGIEQDEDGNWRIDPVKFALGAALAGSIGKGKNLFRNGGNPIKYLDDIASKHPNYAQVEWEQGIQPLRFARAGERIRTQIPGTDEYEYSAVKSTFPDWIPEGSRDSELVNRVADLIENKETPRSNANRQKELIDIVAQRIDDKIQIINDNPQIEGLKSDPIDIDAVSNEWKENAHLITGGSPSQSILGDARAGQGGTGKGSQPRDPQNLTQEVKARAEEDLKNIEDSTYSDDPTKKIESKKEALQQYMAFDSTEDGFAEYVPEFTQRLSVTDLNPQDYTDISGWKGGIRDMYRNTERVTGKDWPKVKEILFDPFDASKSRYVDEQKNRLKELDQGVVNKFDIQKKSDESRAIMNYGEGITSRAEVIEEFGRDRANDIFEAERWFRAKYDEMLDEANAVIRQVYPTNPEKIIPKRQNYFRHFQEIGDGFTDIQQLFDTPAQIDPRLEGISAFTTPRSKWLSFAQRRSGKMTSDRDAVGGFLNYLQPFAFTKHITPHIGNMRKFANHLAENTAETDTALNNYIRSMQEYANSLAGKTNPADRYIQNIIPGGRKTFRVLNWGNKRVKANTILGNLASTWAQIYNVPQAIGNAGVTNSTYGAARTIGQNFADNYAMQQSRFIAERYSDRMYNKYSVGILENSKDFAGWLTSVFDEIGTKFSWNAFYEKAIDEGIENPIKYADDKTRRMVAGRGVGEVPLMQKAKTFQLIAPFQLEVQNLWHVLGDNVSKKQFGAIATTFVTIFLMNRVAEEIRGSDVAFDPINATWEAYKLFESDPNKARGAVSAGGRLLGEVGSNVVFGQTFAAMYPRYGTEIGGVQLPTREEFFGDEDPTRFGSGILAMKGLQDPLFKLLPPFGGSQVKKTVSGAQALRSGDVVRGDGELMFEVDSDNPVSVVQNLLFGPYSTDEARKYFNQDSEDRILELEMEAMYEENQELIEDGQRDVAEDNVEALRPQAWEAYKKVKTSKTREKTEENIEKMLPVVRQNKAMIRNGNEEAAQQVVEDMTEEEYAAYEDARDRYETDEFTWETDDEGKGIIRTIGTYAKAVGTDPMTAFDHLFNGEKIRRTDNGTIIVYRMSLDESQQMRADLGAYATTTELELDHKLPLQIGGSNSEENLELVPVDEHRDYTRIGNHIGRRLREGELSKYEAQNLMMLYRKGKIADRDVFDFQSGDDIEDLTRF